MMDAEKDQVVKETGAGDAAAAAALAVVDAYFATINARDWEGYAATMHCPHVRLARGELRVYATPAELADSLTFERLAARTGWHHTLLDEARVVQSAADKVHVAVRFTRYDDAGRPFERHRSFYVVTLRDGRWGIQARSSFVP
jgi:hypothetical protein